MAKINRKSKPIPTPEPVSVKVDVVPDVDPIEVINERHLSWQTNHYTKVLHARQLYETDNLASVLINKVVENEQGPGPHLEATTGNKKLNQQIESLWNDPKCGKDTLDLSGLDWSDFNSLASRHEMVDGDVGCLLINESEDDGLPHTQLVGADQIRTMGDSGIQDVGNGVVINKHGRVTHYRVWDGAESFDYPTSSVVFLARRKQFRDSLGRRIYRGQSVFTANYSLFQSVSRLADAEIKNAIVAAKIIFTITKNAAQSFANQIADAGKTANTGYQKTANRTQPAARGKIDMTGETAPVLEQGEKLDAFQGAHPVNGFSDTFRLYCRMLGAELSLPLELLLTDFSTGSFSAVRAALILVERSFTTRQSRFIHRWLNPILKWWLDRQIGAGKLPNDPRCYSYRWVMPSFPSVDLLKDAQVELILRDLGYRSFSDGCIKRGIDPAEQIIRLAKDNQDLAAAKIPRYHSGSSVPLEITNNQVDPSTGRPISNTTTLADVAKVLTSDTPPDVEEDDEELPNE